MVKTIYRLLAVAGVFSLAACSGGSGSTPSPVSQSLGTQSLPATTQSLPATTQSLPATTQSLSATTQSSSSRTLSSHDRSSRPQRDGAGENGHEDFDRGDDGNGTVVYSSIPKPLKAVASVGFEATSAQELGDGVNLTHRGNLQRVRYVLSSWGCQTGNWYSDNCVTAKGATFAVPITINVYALDPTSSTHVGALLATQTQTFNIPYRPSADNVRCTGTYLGEFYSAVDASCVHGLANVIVFDFAPPRVNLPVQSIYSLVYNTTHYGPHPIGESAPCYTSSGGCGYDSLNVSTDGPGGLVGSVYDPNGIFWNTSNQSFLCSGTAGVFGLDTGPGTCGWGPSTAEPNGSHPQFEVRAGVGDEGVRGHDPGHDRGD
jgi:hypothetical protein